MTPNKNAPVEGGGNENSEGESYLAFPFEATIALAEHRGRVEVELVGAMLADAVVGAAAALEVGLRPDHFGQDDTRLIFFALGWATDHAIDPMTAAECVLRHHHLWDEGQIVGNNGMRWSRAALEGLKARYFPSAALVKVLAVRLIDADCIERMLSEYARLFVRALEDALTPAAWHLHIGGEPAAAYRAGRAA